jgi:hypothetical protein
MKSALSSGHTLDQKPGVLIDEHLRSRRKPPLLVRGAIE